MNADPVATSMWLCSCSKVVGVGTSVCPSCGSTRAEVFGASHRLETFPSGAERSADLAGQKEKLCRYDLIPTVGLRRLAETMAHGAEKYGENNWQKGLPISNCMNHALAHLFAYQAGDRSEDHLGHAMANLFFIAHFEEKP